jgi:peptidyl-prolyl cis-trans isomerase D
MDCGYSKSDSVKLVMVATEEGAEDVELGWFKSTDLQKNISEPAFNGKKGETFTVSNGMGEQTFKIADKSPATPKVKLAILSRNVTASNNTYNKLFNQAKQFVVANNHADSIRKAATEKGWTTVPAHALTENTYKVNNIKSSRDIVKWAFSAEKGQVSDVFECGDQFIIAGLIEINDGEYSPIETVRADLTIQVMNKKKADYITGQIKSVKTLEDAAKLFATEVKTADSISLITPQLGTAGVEPAVIGTALTLTPNTISKPIVGNNGVYLITVGEKRVSDTPINVEEEIKQLSMYTAYTKSSSAIQLLQEKAEIKDNRARFQ